MGDCFFVSKIEFVTPSNAQKQFENLKFFHPAAVVGDNSLFTELMNISQTQVKITWYCTNIT